ncbi:hypothetical protein K3555_07370 [Leisingera sp. M527]|uniref:hypothetical protein n=1 Tax=unclassified Leisingera TaxID=2614906 RepID=UPI001010FAD2|nr:MULTISPECIES: hypothetical protein [unclassified Leisingera]MBQ4824790.1 hypothetical protein [Leisingera sp. HS039]MCF6429781.1 hypothetical protein [Leisingera sp. MMG026]QAX29970.1 hypothetical protein ETW24_11675 [Leisingera sp. NJS204]QBR36702.1 hypothetical protein ETW23_11680 [Leisingera sp. NJS201]UWQ31054.1 hypothetical protein K3557_06225 [Leisingera sp. M523]
MTLNSIINMVLRRLVSRAVNAGVNAGISAVAKRGKGQPRSAPPAQQAGSSRIPPVKPGRRQG